MNNPNLSNAHAMNPFGGQDLGGCLSVSLTRGGGRHPGYDKVAGMNKNSSAKRQAKGLVKNKSAGNERLSPMGAAGV